MWLSNTATTMMMFPIALSVIHVMKENQEGGNYAHFNLSMMLAIAWASNFGGIATIIGTPPNVQFVGYFEKKYNINIDFVDWMILCTPLALILMFALYIVTTKFLFPNHIRSSEAARKHIHGEIALLGKFSRPEKRVLMVFGSTALLWIFKDLINAGQSIFKLDDNMIAIMGGLALFIFPAGASKEPDEKDQAVGLLEWTDTKDLAWGILLLFGGGIALADAMEKAGLITQLGWASMQVAESSWYLWLRSCLYLSAKS
jgi:sodium-dependent dicarboxylate transporter 2/3/5